MIKPLEAVLAFMFGIITSLILASDIIPRIAAKLFYKKKMELIK